MFENNLSPLDYWVIVLGIAIMSTATLGAALETFKYKLLIYVIQSLFLVVLAIALSLAGNSLWFLLVAFTTDIKLLLIIPLMALTTLEPDPRNLNSPRLLNKPSWWRYVVQTWREFANTSWAEEYWREYGIPRSSTIWSLFSNILLIFIAYYAAHEIRPTAPLAEINGLGAALALLLIGLFTMINEQDMPSHVIGLLVMENGLTLAAITFIRTDTLIIWFFIVGIFTYILVTSFILAIFSPRLHRSSATVYVGEQKALTTGWEEQQKRDSHGSN